MENVELPELNSYSYKPLRKQVYEVLREAILTGNLQPGVKITEAEIADRLNVSRTPVREAIRILELEDLIVVVPRRGKFVAGIRSEREINEIFQVREELEGLAAYLAARRIKQDQLRRLKNYAEEIQTCIDNDDLGRCVEIDISFHQIIYKVADNTWLQKFLDRLFEQITRFRSESLSRKDRMKETLDEHKHLCQALERGDAKQAREFARKHIENARQSVISVFTNRDN